MYDTQFRLFRNFSSTPRTNSFSVGRLGPCRSCIEENREGQNTMGELDNLLEGRAKYIQPSVLETVGLPIFSAQN